ncbi:hypothetical protein ABPG77_004482 [Micractinium sp. CCAP 211/92]
MDGDGVRARLLAALRSLVAASVAAATAFWRELTLQEVSGSLGDLGTFLPLLVGLTKTSGLNLSTTLIFTGLYNILTGLAFGLPMPVQPMKTIAAVALSQAALTVPQIMAAGIFVAACVLVLGATGSFWLASKLIPAPVIRGMQLGLGLGLAKKGWQQAWYADGKSAPARGWWGPEGLLLALFALALILLSIYPAEQQQQEQHESSADEGVAGADEAGKLCAADQGRVGSDAGNNDSAARRPLLQLKQGLEIVGSCTEQGLSGGGSGGSSGCHGGMLRRGGGGSRLPAALLLVVLGVLLTLAYHPDVMHSLSFGPSAMQALVPSAHDWRIGILQAGLPQLVLTSFNSVISVTQLAGDLFPNRPTTPDRVALSVGAMNLVGCWFGAMPCCHGSGGLAAQVRFGARTGAAPVFLGLVKLGLGLLFGSSLLSLLKNFPSPLLGAMLVFAGIELAACGRSQRSERGTAVLLLTAAATLAMGNVALGVVAGLIAAYLLVAWDLAVAQAAPVCRRIATACRLPFCSQQDSGARHRRLAAAPPAPCTSA